MPWQRVPAAFDWLWRFAALIALAVFFTGFGFLLPEPASAYFRTHRTIFHLTRLAFYAPALLLAVVRYVWGGKDSWNTLPEVRAARWLATSNPLAAVTILTAAYAAVMGAGLLLRHEAFFTAVWDIGWADNALWNIVHGNFPRCRILSAGIIDSLEPRYIFYLIAPLYFVCDNIRVLLLIGGLSGAAVLPFLYAAAKQFTGSAVIGLLFAAAWVMYVPATSVVHDDFHAGGFANPFLLGGFYFTARKRWKTGLLFYALALISTESVTVCVLGVILYYLTNRATRPQGFALALLTAAFVAVATLPPLVLHTGPSAPARWRFILSIAHPDYLKRLLEPFHPLPLVIALLAPFAFLSLASWRPILLAAPIYAFILLMPKQNFRDITTHYMEGITGMTAMAAVVGFAAWTRRDPQRTRRAAQAVLAASIFFAGPGEPFYLERLWKELSPEYLMWDRWLSAMPQAFSVRATSMLAAHLGRRKALYLYGDPFIDATLEDRVPDVVVIDRTRDLPMWAPGGQWAKDLQDFRARGYRLVFRSHSKNFELYASPGLDPKALAAYEKRLEEIGRETQVSLRRPIRERLTRIAQNAVWAIARRHT